MFDRVQNVTMHLDHGCYSANRKQAYWLYSLSRTLSNITYNVCPCRRARPRPRPRCRPAPRPSPAPWRGRAPRSGGPPPDPRGQRRRWRRASQQRESEGPAAQLTSAASYKHHHKLDTWHFLLETNQFWFPDSRLAVCWHFHYESDSLCSAHQVIKTDRLSNTQALHLTSW